MTTLAIVEAFAHLPDSRRGAGQRHNQALCLALFTLAVTAGCRGFLAIGDWLNAYHNELVALFAPAKGRLTLLQHNSPSAAQRGLSTVFSLFSQIF